MRAKIALLLLSPAFLSGCGSIDLPSINLSAIKMPWEDSAPKAPDAAALRGDAAVDPPDGMQVEDLRAPFGAQPQGGS
jgi:hypothetical protein